ncbi:MAG: hypothetical protein WBX01_07480 [Nitrososphaeraceae archaeon]
MSQPQILNIISDGLIAPLGNHVTYYTFSIPEDAVNPRLVGHYNVLSGQGMDVTVIDNEGCTLTTGSCALVYQTTNRNSGDVDLPLTSGKTYVLGFHNPDSSAGERTTQVDFYAQYE